MKFFKFLSRKSVNNTSSEEKTSLKKYKIEKMHCVNCSLLIDDTAEQVPGVIEAKTSYAKAEIQIKVQPHFSEEELIKVIADIGYDLVKIEG